MIRCEMFGFEWECSRATVIITSLSIKRQDGHPGVWNIHMKLLLWLSCIPHTQISTLWSKWVLSITWQEQKAFFSEIPSQVCQSQFIQMDTYKNPWKSQILLWVCTVGPTAKFGQIIFTLYLFLQSKSWQTELILASRHLCGIKYRNLLGLVWF